MTLRPPVLLLLLLLFLLILLLFNLFKNTEHAYNNNELRERERGRYTIA